ncbi:hypothetical protein [Paraburkholderia tropica]|nr:hypothetical protein [Paraburkholderia tropica]RQN40999.1 hypothetical protein EHZ25_01810 [Paraburkholderia tropica]
MKLHAAPFQPREDVSMGNAVPLVGCYGGNVLWITSDDVDAVHSEATLRATQARALSAALSTVSLDDDGVASTLRAAMEAIDTLLSDALGLYEYAHKLSEPPRRPV